METAQTEQVQNEIDFFDLLLVLLKRKRLILSGTFVIGIISLVVVFLVAETYQGVAKIMPPQQSSASASAMLGAMLGGAASTLLGSSLGTTTSDLYVGLLTTPAITDPLIDKFELVKLYKQETRKETVDLLIDKIIKAESDPKSGIISLTVEDEDPKRAADMANFMVDRLTSLLNSLAVTDAGKRRLYFEQQLQLANLNLMKAEESLQGFQESTGAIRIEDQAAAVLQGIGALKAQITAKEVQVQMMRGYATPYNPDLKRLEDELQALKSELKKLEEKGTDNLPNVIIPTEQIPTIGKEYIRKMREFKYNETLYEVLAKQYEAARLEEAKDAAVVQVISPAEPADKRAKPKRGLIVIVATGVGMFLFMLAAFGLETAEKALEEPTNQERYSKLKGYLKKF